MLLSLSCHLLCNYRQIRLFAILICANINFAWEFGNSQQLISTNKTGQQPITIPGIFLHPSSTTTTIKWESHGWMVKEPSPNSVTLDIYLTAPYNKVQSFQLAFTDDPIKCGNLSTRHTTKYDSTFNKFKVTHTFIKEGTYYVCVKLDGDSQEWFHQGNTSTVTFNIQFYSNYKLPLMASICTIIVCLILSGLFSGLNLGLMSLDLADLKIFQEAGSVNEKYYASIIYPIRKHGNFLLCSILISNTLVNCAQTILIDGILHGLYATILATVFIVIFGEIIPQAICSRYGLAIGAKTAFFTKTIMFITSPLSWPFSKCLDFMLGKQGPTAYTREKIRVLIREQLSDVEPDEMDVITGVLALRDKTADKHMQKLKDVYMVDADEMFDEKLYAQICDSGYSRIPVYSDERSNVIGVLHIKDLALISTSNHRSVGTICESFNLPFGKCDPQDGLDKLMRYILHNHFHMLLVQTYSEESEKFETIGTITLEDIIEEMINLEILDEFDANMEQKSNRFGKYKNIMSKNKSSLSPQLKVGAMQVLSTLHPFTEEVMTSDILGKLIDQNYVEERNCQQKALYEIGKLSDYFTLIISGKANVEAGRERLKFEVGHFAWFGLSALESEDGRRAPFIPDYSVYLTGNVGYVKITRINWLAATRVSAFERTDPSDTNFTHTNSDRSKLAQNVPVVQVKFKPRIEKHEQLNTLKSSYARSSDVEQYQDAQSEQSRPVKNILFERLK
ncbi:hypothetical protein GJ496_010334 [Pomphorhynchus laevis]|nr:hypothetical protein GJ496_010334 [Pomphorhynchus laevis]